MDQKATKTSDGTTDRDEAALPHLPAGRKSGGAPKRPKRRWIKWAVLLGVVAGLAVGAPQIATFLPPMGDRATLTPPVTAAQPAGPPQVMGLGTLRPRGDVTTVAPPSGASEAVVSEMMVEVGDRVDAGDILAALDTRPLLQAALDRAQANVTLREFELAAARAMVEAEREDARAQVEINRLVLDNAERAADRAERLSADGALAQSQRDEILLDRLRAAAALDQAQTRLNRFGGPLADQPDVAAARAAVTTAQADLAAAHADLAQAIVRAPVGGTVLEVLSRPGERPGTAGILRIGNTDTMEARVEVYQNRIGLVAPGDTVQLTSPALSGALSGSVTRIGLEVQVQGEVSDDPAANTNARVVEVIVTLDDNASQIASRFTNLQVLAAIDVGDQP